MTARRERLLIRAHGATARATGLVFGDDGPLLASRPAPEPAADHGLALCGPEAACAQSAAAQGWTVDVSDQLGGPDAGRWTGLSLDDVAAADPAGLAGWLSDPDARPHGGETLTELVGRLGRLLHRSGQAATGGPERPGRWVGSPLAVRALVVAALGAPASVIFAVDVGFDGEVLLSGSGGRWRLQGLRH